MGSGDGRPAGRASTAIQAGHEYYVLNDFITTKLGVFIAYQFLNKITCQYSLTYVITFTTKHVSCRYN